MMALKLRIQLLIVLLIALILVIQGCAAPLASGIGEASTSAFQGDVPTWTPRPQDLTQTALPTATFLAPLSSPTIVPRTATPTPVIAMSPQTVRVLIRGGNLFVRRGPGLDYDYVDVLLNGDAVLATGRDRVSRWIRIALPSKPEADGWITTETDYTFIDGDIPNLPYIETRPARPAYIRNCTKHRLWVLPADVYLLSKFDKPYNEERFPVGLYKIYDPENPGKDPFEEVSLSEGETVDIQYDWTGERSKCE